MSLQDYIRDATANLRYVAAAMPSSGSGVSGAVYLGFNGNSGQWKLSKEVVPPESLGRILVPQHAFYEGMVEWANGSPLQKCQRPLRGVVHTEPMSEKMLRKPLSPGAYRQDTDGPAYMLGFAGMFFDDGATVVFEHTSGGGRKAIDALNTASIQALAAFGEPVHAVITLGVESYSFSNRTVFNPKLTVVGYVTDKRAREVEVLADSDILTRPTPSRAKLKRAQGEAPAI
jgi:hypothetical protein